MKCKNLIVLFILFNTLSNQSLFSQKMILSKGVKYELPNAEKLNEIAELDKGISTSVQLGSEILKEIMTTLSLMKRLDKEVSVAKTNLNKPHVEQPNSSNNVLLDSYNESLALYNQKLQEYNDMNFAYNNDINNINSKPQEERLKKDFDDVNQKRTLLLEMKSRLDEMSLSLKNKYDEIKNQSSSMQNAGNEVESPLDVLKNKIHSQKMIFSKAYYNLMLTKSYFDDYVYFLGKKHSVHVMDEDKGLFGKVEWYEAIEKIQFEVEQFKNISIEIIIDE